LKVQGLKINVEQGTQNRLIADNDGQAPILLISVWDFTVQKLFFKIKNTS